MIYSLFRPLIFKFDAECAHHLALNALERAHGLCLTRMLAPAPRPQLKRTVMGIDFPNPVGLAAGLDKNGEHIDALAELGFGFIEVGTVTPRPQPGNPKPRLFRLPQHEAIINRMGFNNDGVDKLVENVKRARFKGVLGINIGKNFDTPIERAVDDYLIGLAKVYPHASYVTVNISSPNTKNLRDLQQSDELEKLLAALKAEQRRLSTEHGRHVPLALKIAPDLVDEQIDAIAEKLVRLEFDAVIATNTTISRDKVAGHPLAGETGGLSGTPVRDASTAVIRRLAGTLQGKVPIIGVGGIFSATDAREKLAAGASLVQIYTGLIYRGPELVREICDGLAVQP
jgi:dihydroorotate dehydrogenase